MPSKYFYCDRETKIGGKMYQPGKSYLIPKSCVPEIIVLSEGGIVHLTDTMIVPSLPAIPSKASDTQAKKTRKKKEVKLP